MTREEFALLADTLPAQPGIYRYFDQHDQVIYVGKAKHLRKRISSYFSKQTQYYKTQRLVSEIARIECTLVQSEHDALLLENSLIKQYQPRYNMMLKDDKTFPYIVIKQEEFPRVFLTRRLIKDGSEYLGPYTSVEQVRDMLAWMRQTFPIRSCNLPLTEKSIAKGKFRECLEYHIGNCKAPCTGLQSKESYQWMVQQIQQVLKGKTGEMVRYYKEEMQQYAASLEFEKAEIVKRKLEALQQMQFKSVVVNPRLGEVDVCTVVSNDQVALVNYLVVSQGSIIHSQNIPIEKRLNESDQEILSHVLLLMRERFESRSVEILSDQLFEIPEPLKITLPKSGDKKKLLELSQQNAQYAFREWKRQWVNNAEGFESVESVLQEMQDLLRLPRLPRHIECFDNSNFQGAYPVAAMVCFQDGKPSKNQYRRFHIKTVQGIDDFASMGEIVFRRYKRLLDEQRPLPDLIIIDGGKGQLHAACDSLQKLDLLGKIPIAGLAKQKEELFFPGDQESILLPYCSNSLHLITRIRDEVHRFGITFHRNTRSAGALRNELESIEGIGRQTAQTLLKRFRSVKNIGQQDVSSLEAVIGHDKALKVFRHFHPGASEALSNAEDVRTQSTEL